MKWVGQASLNRSRVNIIQHHWRPRQEMTSFLIAAWPVGGGTRGDGLARMRQALSWF